MVFNSVVNLYRVRRKYTDLLVTLLTILFSLIIFVFSPLQAAGYNLVRLLEVAALLAVIGSVLVISTSRIAFAMMTVAFVTNVIVILYRLYWPTDYDLYVVASAWLVITISLGVVVTQAVFRRGRVTYHRIVGAILLYELIALIFVMLFTFVGLAYADAFKGISFEHDAGLASRLIYFSFMTLTSTGYGDMVPVHPLARSLCNLEAFIGQFFTATLLARLVTLEVGKQPRG